MQVCLLNILNKDVPFQVDFKLNIFHNHRKYMGMHSPFTEAGSFTTTVKLLCFPD